MKLLVCISSAPDTTSKIDFTDNNTRFNSQGVTYIVNPYDEWYALVRALELKETLGATVTIINVGPVENDAIVRKAIALGIDDAVRIDATPADAYFTANEIAQYAKDKGFDIILCGKETIDFNGSMVGGIVAGLLDLPFVSLAGKLDVTGTTATLEREIAGGKEIIEIQMPFVLSASKGMAEQRIPNMRGIMAARTKAIQVLPATTNTAPTAATQYALPPTKQGVKLVSADNVEELVNLLHNEAKVI